MFTSTGTRTGICTHTHAHTHTLMRHLVFGINIWFSDQVSWWVIQTTWFLILSTSDVFFLHTHTHTHKHTHKHTRNICTNTHTQTHFLGSRTDWFNQWNTTFNKTTNNSETKLLAFYPDVHLTGGWWPCRRKLAQYGGLIATTVTKDQLTETYA